jgi:putative transposase
MPWRERSSVDERVEFIQAYRSGVFGVTELAEQFGVSRKTAHKWIARFDEEGFEGLVDRSRRPLESPLAIPKDIVDEVIAARRKLRRWGPKKLRDRLAKRQPTVEWPAVSTIALILKRNGLADGKRRKRTPIPADGRVEYVQAREPNLVWTTDFKGKFRTGDGWTCHPLTIMDRRSRFLLACHGMSTPSFELTKPVFERVFREFGLPKWVHSDNGTPFGSPGLARLSRLQVWWLRLGIFPEPIRPSHPEENAEHERMHRTLKADTARPPASNGAAQQRRFGRFRQEYNFERPHESLGMRTPGEIYEPSSREYPAKLMEPEYPGHFEVRRVKKCGSIKWKGERIFVSEVLRHELVGLEEVDDDVWDVHFASAIVARLDGRERRLIGTGRLRTARRSGQLDHAGSSRGGDPGRGRYGGTPQ